MDADSWRELLPHDPNLHLTQVQLGPDAVTVEVAVLTPSAECPRCGRGSEHVYSRYTRRLNDLPCGGRTLSLVITARRFRCANPACSQAIFCERLPNLAPAHARTTGPLTESHRAIGFAVGGEAGARLAERLAMPTSPDTLLRRVKAAPEEVGPPPRYVGIDDWAWRKGQSYGTVVTDLERGRVIDIFPGRDGEALKQWLHANPQVEVITRDRWPAYAKAATDAAPQARQGADRWHLLKNLREAIERLFARRASSVQTALNDPLPTEPTAEPPSAPVAEPVGPPAVPGESIPEPTGTDAGSPREQARHAKRARRAELHQRVRALRERGLSLRQIARTTGASVKTVIRYIRQDRCPDWHPGRRSPTQLDGSAAFIGEWLADGGRNTAELYRLLKGGGCRASYDAVRRFVNRTLGSTGRPGPRVGQTKPAPAPRPSARRLSFVFIRRPEDRKPTEQNQVNRLQARSPALGATLDLAEEFAAMIHKRSSTAFSDWLAKAELCPDAELRLFAVSLRQDEAAVGAALTTHWSNGPVEGQVNRLKFIKRAGYGRAGFPLLRARVCQVA